MAAIPEPLSKPSTISHLVKPSSKHAFPTPDPIPLHPIDRLMPPVAARLHFFYPPPLPNPTPTCASLEPIPAPISAYPTSSEELGASHIVQVLKSAFADALEYFPPMAGSLRPDPASPGCILVHCDGKGGDFITEYRDYPYSDVKGGDCSSLSARGMFFADPEEPLIAVKLTQFSCGSLCIATSIHHQLCDGSSTIDFISTWAALSRRAFHTSPHAPFCTSTCAQDHPSPHAIANGSHPDASSEKSTLGADLLPFIPKFWTRNPLVDYFTPDSEEIKPLDFLPGYATLSGPLPPPPPSATKSDAESAAESNPPPAPSWSGIPKPGKNVYVFVSEENLKHLKEACTPPSSPNSTDKAWISSGDALTTLSLRAITRARGRVNLLRSSSEPEKEVAVYSQTLGVAVDGRERSLGKAMARDRYFGNFVTPVVTELDVLDLFQDSFGPNFPGYRCMRGEQDFNRKSKERNASMAKTALSIRAALQEQLQPTFLAQKLKSMENAFGFNKPRDPERPPTALIPHLDISLTNWLKFDLTGSNKCFGWGRPISVSEGRVRFVPGIVVVLRARVERDTRERIGVQPVEPTPAEVEEKRVKPVEMEDGLMLILCIEPEAYSMLRTDEDLLTFGRFVDFPKVNDSEGW